MRIGRAARRQIKTALSANSTLASLAPKKSSTSARPRRIRLSTGFTELLCQHKKSHTHERRPDMYARFVPELTKENAEVGQLFMSEQIPICDQLTRVRERQPEIRLMRAILEEAIDTYRLTLLVESRNST